MYIYYEELILARQEYYEDIDDYYDQCEYCANLDNCRQGLPARCDQWEDIE